MTLNTAFSVRSTLTGGLMIAGLVLLIWGIYIPLKGALAQILLEAAWEQAQKPHPLMSAKNGTGEKMLIHPWPGADMYPIGKLELTSARSSWIVVGGATPRNLAFAPVWSEQSVRPGASGVAIISGHKDTQFAALEHVQSGDRLRWTTERGEHIDFVVRETAVINATETQLTLDAAGPARLLLVTCFPFDSSYGGPLRYVVLADAVHTSPIVRVALE